MSFQTPRVSMPVRRGAVCAEGAPEGGSGNSGAISADPGARLPDVAGGGRAGRREETPEGERHVKRTIIAISLAIVVFPGVWKTIAWLTSTPVPRQSIAAARRGSQFRGDTDEFAGYGWSIDPDTGTAIREALAKFPSGAGGGADIALVFYSSQHAPEDVAGSMRRRRERGTRVCGWSSDLGVIGPDGYHCGAEGTVGLLCMRLPGVKAGVGGARLDEARSPAACAKLALRRAIEDAAACEAGRTPSIIIMSATYDGHEEVYLESLREAVGSSVPVLGGTAGGSEARGPDTCSVIANDTVIRKGLVLAVMYSESPFRWSFRGGFQRTSKCGVITSSEGRVIGEIDGIPALDVYDEWCCGRLAEAMRAGENLNTFTGLYPMCRTLKSANKTHNLFVHAWPATDAGRSRALVTSANLRRGDLVHFCEGSWNILLNRIGVLAQEAKGGFPETGIAAGLFICCEAVLKNIPPGQRNQMAHLINRSMGDAPWIGMFTWGEQGNFPGIGNYHGNLLTSITLFPEPAHNAEGR